MLLALLGVIPAAVAGEKPRVAEVQVSGLGWWGNRDARQTLARLNDSPNRPVLDANSIEDASLILFSELTEKGYLAATMTAEVTRADGAKASYPLDAKLEHALPRPLEAQAVTLQVERGPQYFLSEVTFEGLHALPEKDALAFFVGESFLLTSKESRLYSPDHLARSVANLRLELMQRGYSDTTVETPDVRSDPKDGSTHVRVVVNEGTLSRVAALNFQIAAGGAVPTGIAEKRVGKPWSPNWRQDTVQAIRRWYYEHGHPDVQVRLEATGTTTEGAERGIQVTAQVNPGSEVHLKEVRFTGNTHTKEKVLRRSVPAKGGDLLDRTKLDDGASRLARLGVFSRIELAYDPPDGTERAAVYSLAEGRRQEVNLLAGYGSYEKLRGGVEWRHFNLFGLAHNSDLLLVQSTKSTSGNYTYTVPELLGAAADGSVQVFGLRREELAFLREEYGTTFSLLWPLRKLGASLTTGYTYQSLNNSDNNLATSTTDEGNTISASLDFGFVMDKRDSPLTPHRGYKIFARVNAASKYLGGETDYQQASLGASWHTPWGHGRWVHVGFAHAVVTTLGAPEGSEPPVNVLFYPGGDDSIRGYSKGEAAPRAPNGDFIGAKVATQLNLELEQAITSKWSAVVFIDALGTATRLQDYPWSEELYSAGVGIRWQTIIGPVRLEYGYNLNPRPLDPSGTLLFSVGFPF